jgi:2-dehydro-3-deoxygalactonokinase
LSIAAHEFALDFVEFPPLSIFTLATGNSQMLSEFTSCDWGTSNLRVRRVVDGRVAGEAVSEKGVSRVRGNFPEILQEAMQEINATPPVVVSGMAGSSIGWQELAYAELPFPLDGSGASSVR